MSLTNFDNFQPMNEKLNKSDVKYSMEMAFANQGGNWYKALKRVEVKGDKIKLNMSSYMAPGELLQKIVDEFNDIMLTDFRINKDSFQKGSVTIVGSTISTMERKARRKNALIVMPQGENLKKGG